MGSTEQSIRELAARIRPMDQECARSVLKRLPEDLGQLRSLASAIAGAQRLTNPSAATKGFALFAADAPGRAEVSERLRELLGKHSRLHTLANHFDVKLATVDVGLNEEVEMAGVSSQIIRQRMRMSSENPASSMWESLQAGIRVACLMKGKDTNIFGLGILREGSGNPARLSEMVASSEWSLGAAAGFLLAASDLQTPVVVSGPDAAIAAGLACELAPAVKDYLIPAESGHFNDANLTALFPATMPHEMAIIITLSVCDGAARLMRSY